jgi:uncharacterized membrane protein (DUF4010 family)
LDLDFYQELDLVRRLAVATLIGLLVGIERGWRERDADGGMRTAGIRTFTLIGLIGGVLGLIARGLNDATGAGLLIAIGFVAFTGAFAAFRMRENIQDKNFGFTTVAAALATFSLGVYAVVGDQNIAAAAGVAVMAILAVRESLHGLLSKITWNELRAAIILLSMTFLALPLIPDQNYGPYGGINPRQVWLLAVILAAVSFLGYVAIKVMGPKQGTLVSSAAGGLVSSTAVTLAASRRAAESKASHRLEAASVAIATAVSLARTLTIILALNYSVGLQAAAPLAGGALAALMTGLLLIRLGEPDGKGNKGFELRNPFSLQETLLLAGVIAIVTFATQVFAAWFGAAGALVTAAIAGTVDNTAPTISMARLGSGALPPAIAALGVLIAAVTNNLFKFMLGTFAGGRSFAMNLVLAIGVPMAVLAAIAAGQFLYFGGLEAAASPAN